jgi:hypothetical protein
MPLKNSGAPRAKPVAPYPTSQWGDIPAKGWRIHPRPKAVAFCCRGKNRVASLIISQGRINVKEQEKAPLLPVGMMLLPFSANTGFNAPCERSR